MATIDKAKLAKMLGMIGSSEDGEALAAARAANKLVADAGLTWAQVLGDPALSVGPVHPYARRAPSSWSPYQEARRASREAEEKIRQRMASEMEDALLGRSARMFGWEAIELAQAIAAARASAEIYVTHRQAFAAAKGALARFEQGAAVRFSLQEWDHTYSLAKTLNLQPPQRSSEDLRAARG